MVKVWQKQLSSIRRYEIDETGIRIQVEAVDGDLYGYSFPGMMEVRMKGESFKVNVLTLTETDRQILNALLAGDVLVASIDNDPPAVALKFSTGTLNAFSHSLITNWHVYGPDEFHITHEGHALDAPDFIIAN